jgi:hypothetical protein
VIKLSEILDGFMKEAGRKAVKASNEELFQTVINNSEIKQKIEDVIFKNISSYYKNNKYWNYNNLKKINIQYTPSSKYLEIKINFEVYANRIQKGFFNKLFNDPEPPERIFNQKTYYLLPNGDLVNTFPGNGRPTQYKETLLSLGDLQKIHNPNYTKPTRKTTPGVIQGRPVTKEKSFYSREKWSEQRLKRNISFAKKFGTPTILSSNEDLVKIKLLVGDGGGKPKIPVEIWWYPKNDQYKYWSEGAPTRVFDKILPLLMFLGEPKK